MSKDLEGKRREKSSCWRGITKWIPKIILKNQKIRIPIWKGRGKLKAYFQR